MMPYLHSEKFLNEILFLYAIQKINKAIKNLMKTKNTGEIKLRETFIRGNESPHEKVMKSKINSALYNLINGLFSLSGVRSEDN